MAVKLGKNAKLYKAAALLAAADAAAASAATWTEITNVRDLTLPNEKVKADVTTRANNGFKQTAGTMKDAAIEFQMVNKEGDTMLAALRAAYFADTEVALAVMDGAIATTGNEGLVSNFVVTKYQRGEELENAQLITIEICPSEFTQWYVVA